MGFSGMSRTSALWTHFIMFNGLFQFIFYVIVQLVSSLLYFTYICTHTNTHTLSLLVMLVLCSVCFEVPFVILSWMCAVIMNIHWLLFSWILCHRQLCIPWFRIHRLMLYLCQRNIFISHSLIFSVSIVLVIILLVLVILHLSNLLQYRLLLLLFCSITVASLIPFYHQNQRSLLPMAMLILVCVFYEIILHVARILYNSVK